MKKPSQKSVDHSQIASVDKTPTNFNGWNPDTEGRLSMAVMKDGSRKYLYDGVEEISTGDAVGALTGKDSIPRRTSVSVRYKPGQYERLFGKKEK